MPAGRSTTRSRGKVVGGLIAVVALIGAGGFAISKIVAGTMNDSPMMPIQEFVFDATMLFVPEVGASL